MNWNQFKDSVSLCLAGAAVVFWSLTQDVAGLNPFTGQIFLSLNSAKAFRQNSNSPSDGSSRSTKFLPCVTFGIHCI